MQYAQCIDVPAGKKRQVDTCETSATIAPKRLKYAADGSTQPSPGSVQLYALLILLSSLIYADHCFKHAMVLHLMTRICRLFA